MTSPDIPSSFTGTFQIHYFASAASYTKKNTESFPAPYPLCRLFDLLESHYPGIKGKVLSSCAVSVRMEYVDGEELDVGTATDKTRMVECGDEVAIIPPVSSG
ncbi:molybdopterin synthase small subunit CnxG [Arthroderma uncinatum]|uniref:molybdopterin synthase small subunit CnxG n=1 Tax=Arthroderma uncinatum TaxID=74035 RepID=UPI00144A9DC4|nr:molybdopterin synthase small subunit CnxG [Arthroderma uncinatum]KAF3483941.1 molybdopterin synthase small subunit CnxG [Arthroderma uncinatum]